MRTIDADKLKKVLSDKDYITYTHEFGDAIPVDWIMSAIDNAPTVEERLQEWITIEAGENSLEDHYWYLIVHKDYETPMKAKYHDDCTPHFTFYDAKGERATYLFEDKITHYMKLPEFPEEVNNETN